MNDYNNFLTALDAEMKRLKSFWESCHSLSDALHVTETMQLYEIGLVDIIGRGTASEKAQASQCYQDLIPLLRHKPQRIDECSAPDEIIHFDYCNDP